MAGKVDTSGVNVTDAGSSTPERWVKSAKQSISNLLGGGYAGKAAKSIKQSRKTKKQMLDEVEEGEK